MVCDGVVAYVWRQIDRLGAPPPLPPPWLCGRTPVNCHPCPRQVRPLTSTVCNPDGGECEGVERLLIILDDLMLVFLLFEPETI